VKQTKCVGALLRFSLHHCRIRPSVGLYMYDVRCTMQLQLNVQAGADENM